MLRCPGRGGVISLALFPLLLGCAGGEDSAAPAADPPAWEYTPEGGDPEWTAEETAAALSDMMASPLPVPGDFLAAYADVRSHGDDACPGKEYSFQVLEGCTAESGWWYIGMMSVEQSETTEGVEDFMYADGQIVSPDGTRFAIVGSVWAQLRLVEDLPVGGVGYFAALLEDETEGSGFEPPVDALLSFSAERRNPYPTATLDGPVEYAGGVADFQQLTFNSLECGQGPTGSVLLRDDASRWYTFSFGDDCDECGDVTGPDGTDLGSACAELGDVGIDLAERFMTAWR